MKKLVLSLSTFALIAASIFVFSSCEKEEKQEKIANIENSSLLISQNELLSSHVLSPKIYGQIHNEICNYLINNYSNQIFSSFNQF